MNLENSNQLWLESVDQVRLILFALYKRTIFTRVWLILPLFIIEIIWKNVFVEKAFICEKVNGYTTTITTSGCGEGGWVALWDSKL